MNGISIWDIKKKEEIWTYLYIHEKQEYAELDLPKGGGDQKYWDNWDNWVKGNRRIEQNYMKGGGRKEGSKEIK